MDKQINGWMDGCIDGFMQMHALIGGMLDGYMDGWNK